MFNVNSFAAEPAAHEYPAEAHQLMLDAGKKWATDEPLRKGMGEICKVVAADLKAIHSGYEALATVESVDMGQGFSSPLRIA
jgi:hypothetical protein